MELLQILACIYIITGGISSIWHYRLNVRDIEYRCIDGYDLIEMAMFFLFWPACFIGILIGSIIVNHNKRIF
jgi:hypothetical protein